MSVGGTVVEVIPMPGRLWIDTVERSTGDHCAIYVEATPEARSVSEGDQLWWQGDQALWTPRYRTFTDRRLRRIGCSGVSRDQALERKSELEVDAILASLESPHA